MKFIFMCAWLWLALPVTAAAEGRPLRLLAEAWVQGGSVRLQDLLPRDAGAQLKAAAGKVSLGHAPEFGSLRVFAADELRRAMAEEPGLGSAFDGVEIPQRVIVRRIGWQLAIETVRLNLSRSDLARKFNFSQARIILPPSFTTADPSPKLDLIAITPSLDHLRLLARIRCRERVECGSFLAEIVLSGSTSEVMANEPKSVPERLTGRISFQEIRKSLTQLDPGPVLVLPGRLALLTIDGEGFKITQPVIPLRPARLGELVRVSDPHTHRSWLAQVAGIGQLRPPGGSRQKETR